MNHHIVKEISPCLWTRITEFRQTCRVVFIFHNLILLWGIECRSPAKSKKGFPGETKNAVLTAVSAFSTDYIKKSREARLLRGSVQSIMGREFKSQILLNAILHNTQLENENKDDKNISGKLKTLHIQDMIQMHVGAGGGRGCHLFLFTFGKMETWWFILFIQNTIKVKSAKGIFLIKRQLLFSFLSEHFSTKQRSGKCRASVCVLHVLKDNSLDGVELCLTVRST